MFQGLCHKYPTHISFIDAPILKTLDLPCFVMGLEIILYVVR